MGIPLSTLIKPTVIVIFIAFGSYLNSYRFVRRRQWIEYPRLHLSQFPEEIILEILRAVHDTPTPNSRCRLDDEWARYDQGTRDIKNVRLTCQLFNRISSELLIKFVGVDLSAESLARLQAIMRHPGIGRGVGMVRIRLLSYDPILGMDLYVDEMGSRLRSYISQMDQALDQRTMSLAGWYLGGWRLGRPDALEKLRAAAETPHREYRRRYQAQHDLEKGKFIKDVTKALSMSRKPLRIEFTDRDDFIWSDTVATKANLLDVISQPRASTWKGLQNRCPNTSRDYSWMIPLMLIDLSGTRVRIGDLHFDTTTIALPERVFPMEFKFLSGILKATMQNLRSFTFHNDDLRDPGRERPEWRSTLYNCLPPASLRDLVLRRVRLEPMSQCRNLTRISLTQVEFHVERFALFLKPLERHAVDISLTECFLYDDSGDDDSWADVLDLLRSKQRRTRLNWPKGWDIDNMSKENINYLFVHLEDWYEGASKAEQYIRGWLDVNPIRQHLDHSTLAS